MLIDRIVKVEPQKTRIPIAFEPICGRNGNDATTPELPTSVHTTPFLLLDTLRKPTQTTVTNKTNPKAAVTNKIVPTVVSKDGDKGGRDDSQEGQDDDDEQIEQTSRCDDNFVPTVVNKDGASGLSLIHI